MFSDVEAAVIVQSARNEANLRDRGQAIINDKVAKIKRLEKQIAELQAALIKEISFGAASKAQALAFIDEHPDSRLLKPTGLRYEDGRPQKVITSIFDRAFDEKARELGVTDPKRIRDVAK